MRKKSYTTVITFLLLMALFSGCIGPERVETTPPDVTSTIETSAPTSPTSTPITTPITNTPPPTGLPKTESSKVTVKVTDTDGNLLNGIVAFEKGFVHKNRFIMGALVTEGKATIELPKVRDIPEVEWNYWGMHVYATNTIYFPKEIEVIPGEEYEFEIALAPEPNPNDDPIISSIEFEEGSSKTTIKVDISSPKDELGPQNLALNTRTGEVFAMDPPMPVASLRDNFPNGVYTLSYPDADTNPTDWYFVVADHSCSNGPLQGYPVDENIIPAKVDGDMPAVTVAPTGSAVELGAQLVSTVGCGACHYFDMESRFEDKGAKTNWLIGPGLKGLFKKEKLPGSGRDATDENVKLQILEGGSGMPSYSHLSEEEISNMIAYLDSI